MRRIPREGHRYDALSSRMARQMSDAMTRASDAALVADSWSQVHAGDSAAIFRVGRMVGPAAHRRVMRLLARLDAAHLPGVLDLVPAYASVLVHFDPLLTDAATIAAALRALPDSMDLATSARTRTVRIAVDYGGEAGPDLAAVAEHAGLSVQEVVRRHRRAPQRVYFIGFLAGFPYLGNLPRALAVPRLDVPRPRVPAGSVALAGRQTGIYPVASPGGWRLIGRCQMPLFDPSLDPPALLRPGDRVRFVASTDPRVEASSSATPHAIGAGATDVSHEATTTDTALAWLRVARPGALTTVQDAGRRGYARYGVTTSGALDCDALALGNVLLGNPPGAAALEITYGGLACETLAPCLIAVAGADVAIHINGVARPMATALALAPGNTLVLGTPHAGVRSYLCVAGGVAVPPVLGSRATDLRGAFGGYAGRALCAGDVLARGLPHATATELAGRQLPADPVRASSDAAGPMEAPICLRVLPGPHARRFPRDLAALCAGTFAVDPRSDRAGVRLRSMAERGMAERGAAGPAETPVRTRGPIGGEVLSEGVPDGAIQLPPGGEPILLLGDHQTTGGYHIPAVVISADHWRAAQLRPGDHVHLALVSAEEASAALHMRGEWYATVARQLAQAPGASATRQAPDPEVLMRGFAEGSEEEDEDG